MKCVNIRATAETILFDCPHCILEAEITDTTLVEMWTPYEGKVTCPVPTGCNQLYEIPTAEEIAALRAAAPSPPQPPADPAPEEIPTTVESVPTETASTESKEEAEPAEETEEKPKFTGPFRYVSKSEEEGEEDKTNEIEQSLGKKEEEDVEVNSPLMIRTFRRLDCIVQGKNRFDDLVSKFLGEVGRDNVISVTPISYTEKSEGVTDYGVIIYYSQPQTANPPAAAEGEKAAEPIAWRD